MKKTLLFSLLTFFYFNSMAQTTDKKSAVGIAIGPSIPTGAFANKDLANSESGLASVGGFLSLSYNYKFAKHFGFVFNAQGRIYGVSEDALRTYGIPEGTGASLRVSAGNWKMGSVMAGLFQTLPLTQDEKLSFEVSALAGVQSTSSPNISVNLSIPGMGNMSNSQKSISATSFAYSFGAGLKYSLSNSLALKVSGDYVGARPKFVTSTFSSSGTLPTELAQGTGAVNIGFGLNISF